MMIYAATGWVSSCERVLQWPQLHDMRKNPAKTGPQWPKICTAPKLNLYGTPAPSAMRTHVPDCLTTVLSNCLPVQDVLGIVEALARLSAMEGAFRAHLTGAKSVTVDTFAQHLLRPEVLGTITGEQAATLLWAFGKLNYRKKVRRRVYNPPPPFSTNH